MQISVYVLPMVIQPPLSDVEFNVIAPAEAAIDSGFSTSSRMKRLESRIQKRRYHGVRISNFRLPAWRYGDKRSGRTTARKPYTKTSPLVGSIDIIVPRLVAEFALLFLRKPVNPKHSELICRLAADDYDFALDAPRRQRTCGSGLRAQKLV